jgi:hypothetical protein
MTGIGIGTFDICGFALSSPAQTAEINPAKAITIHASR